MSDSQEDLEPPAHTPMQRLRIPPAWWTTYKRVTARLGTNRAARIRALIREDIAKHGDAEDLAALARGDAELAERSDRKGGRPPRSSR